MRDMFDARRSQGPRALRGSAFDRELVAERAADAGPEDAIRSLQATAGNRAVASLFGALAGPSGAAGGQAAAGPVAQRQKAADDEKPSPAQNDTDLMVPADEGTPTPASGSGERPAGAGSAGASPTGGAAPSFEGSLFVESVSKPLQATIDAVRADPPDAEVAVNSLKGMGPTLLDYEQRYRGTDEGLANHFLAIRGWLGGPYRELERRVGNDRPQSDREIADSLAEMQTDTAQIESQLRE